MPYGGTTPAQDAKIERCVTSLMKTGNRTKQQAIAICKASVLGTTKRSHKSDGGGASA